jgi:hypothetical protein
VRSEGSKVAVADIPLMKNVGALPAENVSPGNREDTLKIVRIGECTLDAFRREAGLPRNPEQMLLPDPMRRASRPERAYERTQT